MVLNMMNIEYLHNTRIAYNMKGVLFETHLFWIYIF